MKRTLLVAIVTIVLGTAALAGEPAYVVTLKPEATVGDPRKLALRLANTYGGTLHEGDADEIVIRVSASRASLLAADRNVESITAITDAQRPSTVAATAINWNDGVSYEYDGTGNIKKIGTDTFSYDVVGRIVESHTGGVQRRYEYDAFGNRTKCTQGSDPCQDAEVISASSNQSSIATYDARGNVISQGGHTYTFDELNMLASDQYGALTREYFYNANDQRIGVLTSSSSGAWWRWTFRDPHSGKPLREFSSQGVAGTSSWKWERDYIWRDSLLLATVQPDGTGGATTTYHYHLDHLGTPRRITDDNDRIVGLHDYHPFGIEVPGGTNEPSLSRIKYTGHERDTTETELGGASDYMMARYYSPGSGRFLSVDPAWESADLGKPQSWNRYSYVENNPINRTDPDGRVSWGLLAKAAKLAYKGGDIAMTFKGMVDDVNTLRSSTASLGSKGMAVVSLASEVLSPVSLKDAKALRAASKLPDDALVVRGGVNTPDSFTKGSGVTTNPDGTLSGVSVNSAPGKTVEQLSQGIPHSQVGVTTVGQVRAAGGDVVPSPTPNNCNHCTMNGVTPEKASELMTPTQPNPRKK